MSGISPAEFMGQPGPSRRGPEREISPSEFMGSTPRALQGNSEWASRYARELRGVIVRQATLAPRSQQVHLGPSEIGERCSRQIVGKLVGAQRTNHVSDPWPSIVGTAVHAWLAKAFDEDNARDQTLRWVTETRVTPHPLYPGSADLYDAQEAVLCDHKVLGASSLAKVKSPQGPSRRYRVQLLLYAAGFRNLGLPVRRIVLAAYPRTAATLDSMYVWEHTCGPDDEILLQEVFDDMAVREAAARLVRAGTITLSEVQPTPSDDSCYFCFLYRPSAAYDGGPGCPGTLLRG